MRYSAVKYLAVMLWLASVLIISGCGEHDGRILNQISDAQGGGTAVADFLELRGQTGSPDEFEFLIGSASGDITGPAVGMATAGYAAPAPKTAGIHQRLLSRTFVMAERSNPSRRIALVTTDLCYMTGIVKAAVIDELTSIYGNVYRHENVLIAATHTHSGPAGFSQHAMYNLPSRGFSEENFRAIVSGIVESISQAHDRLEPGAVTMASGMIRGGSRNRSLEAFFRNSREWRRELPNATDESVTMLRFDTASGPIGILHWYATHGTSMTKNNQLISADNKGYAAWRLEKMINKPVAGSPEFVAAFANSNGGDASPNVDGDVDGDGDWECLENDDFKCSARIGELQFQSAVELLSRHGKKLDGVISSTLQFVDMPSLRLPPSLTGQNQPVEVCHPAIGISMLAGSTEDGPGVGAEGVGCDSGNMFTNIRCRQERYQCHGNKPVVLSGEWIGRYGFTAHVVPVQLLTIGSMAIAGVPAEMTAMAGLQLRRFVQNEMAADGVEHVVIGAYANEYSNYVTTREEYQAQHYEGASTLFGEWTLAAYQYVFQNLAQALREELPTETVIPEFEKYPWLAARSSQTKDRHGANTDYGDVIEDTRAIYFAGSTVTAKFQGSNPNNDMRRGASFLEIQKLVNGDWHVIANDRDFNTRLHWEAGRWRQSTLAVEWDIPANVVPGTYRVTISGTANDLRAGPVPYRGESRSFVVNAAE